VFVTGESYYEQTMERIRKKTPELPQTLHLVPYLNNMPEVLSASRLVVGRSGASSLAEITALGVPSILIPSPNVTNNHQEANARSLADAGAAELIVERNLSGTMLFERISALIENEERLAKMGRAALSLGMPQSAALIADELRRLTGKGATDV
jgi:UDP-N-acetylglucosamine--N-acetylmuramyl-(pentapeptide) pyrophosphoryl-undecaprenol N-acetylglucosamine transferase